MYLCEWAHTQWGENHQKMQGKKLFFLIFDFTEKLMMFAQYYFFALDFLHKSRSLNKI